MQPEIRRRVHASLAVSMAAFAFAAGSAVGTFDSTTATRTATAAPPAVLAPTTSAPAPAVAPVSQPAVARPQGAASPAPPPRRVGPAPVGRIEIPKIGLTHETYEGIDMPIIDRGPSHWPGTAQPGQPGNAVFAGHRVTNTRPFRDIDRLVPGDAVAFVMGSVRTTYVVTGHEVVTPKDTWIIRQTSEPTATLFACHPPGSARYRYVVHLRLDRIEAL